MKGMEMMLKSFGFDPEELKRDLDAAKQAAEKYVQQVEARLGAIENRLLNLETKIDAVISAVDKISLHVITPVIEPVTNAKLVTKTIAEKET
jgi:phage-related minor tail protein